MVKKSNNFPKWWPMVARKSSWIQNPDISRYKLIISKSRHPMFRMSSSGEKFSWKDGILLSGCRHPEINYLGKTTSYILKYLYITSLSIMSGCRHLMLIMSSSRDKLSQYLNRSDGTSYEINSIFRASVE